MTWPGERRAARRVRLVPVLVGLSALSWFATGCGPGHPAARPAVATEPAPRVAATSLDPATCRYDVKAVRATAGLDVTVRCTGAVTSGFRADPHVASFTADVRDARGTPLTREGNRWAVSASNDVEIHYRVDLDGAAREEGDVDTAMAVGGSLVAPLSSYALVPDPPRAGTALLHVEPLPGTEFVTVLPLRGDDFTIALGDIPNATYGVFGRFEHDVERLPGVHGAAQLDVVSLDGGFALSRDERRRWIARDAAAVTRFYGGFPAEHVGVVLTPVPGRDRVVFGKVLSTGGSTVVMLVGEDTKRAALDSDWVLVHEMFHIGFPTLSRGAGLWLDEGLATYAEPLIRARAGMLTEEQGWAEVVRDMPRGVRLCETAGLEHFDDIRSVYWGGAVVALLADVEARRLTNGERGLEQALRAMLARGWDARRVVPLRDAIRLVDDELGNPILAGLAASYADHGSPVPLDRVLTELGIERRDHSVRLHDDAPLAAMRRAIMYGATTEARR